MSDDNVYWVVQRRTRVFGTWKPVYLFRTRAAANAYADELALTTSVHNIKVDRVELI